MNKYYVFSVLFLLVMFLWLSVIFFLSGEAAGCVGFCAAALSVALVSYGWNHTEESN